MKTRINKKVMETYKLGEEPNDLKYWLTKSPVERLAALEFLRKQTYDSPTPRLQRVFRIVKMKKNKKSSK